MWFTLFRHRLVQSFLGTFAFAATVTFTSGFMGKERPGEDIDKNYRHVWSVW